jgi:hypothetical protein
MRKHRVIRQEIVTGPQAFAFSVECNQFDNLMATWSNSNTSTGSPTGLVFCPTSEVSTPPDTDDNYPVMPTVPVPGVSCYASVGQNMSNAFPLSDMVSIGVIVPAGVTCTVKVEGDEHEDLLSDPNAPFRARS